MSRRTGTTTWWVVLAVTILTFGWGFYWVVTEVGPTPGLSLAVVVLALGLVGVLVRNLVRLIIERKRGILGARLRTKLVFFFLALVLLPALVLFYGSAQVIKLTVEALVRTPLEDLAASWGDIADQWGDYFEQEALKQARMIAQEIEDSESLSPERPRTLDEFTRLWRRRAGFEAIWVTEGRRPLVAAPQAGDQAHAELEALLERLASDVETSGQAAGRISYLGDGLLVHAAVPLGEESGSDRPRAVIVANFLPVRLAGDLEQIRRFQDSYDQFRVQRNELVRFYLTLIGVIFLAALFIATWIGLYVARRITVPIQQLASAAREISIGNLEVRVQTRVGDEMGTLVDAFNEMAAELQENREVITRSTADLRRSNRALDERRRYIETLLANLSTAVVSLDSDGRVTTANPATEQILGVRLLADDDARAVFEEHGLAPLAELLDPRAEIPLEGLRRDMTLEPGARRIPVVVQISPLRRGTGEQLGKLIMVEDLSDLMRAQRAAAWREVAQRIAHEIKNPLTPIQLSAQRLRKKHASGSTDLDRVLPEATASIEREVGALKTMIDEFSRFARMPEITRQRIDFREVIDSVISLYDGLPGVKLDVALDPAVGSVTLDPQQVRRVLINLIDNAAAAINGEGAIHIRARRAAGGMLRIEIADTGPGIAPQDRERMFIPHFSTKARGSGLGLAIVHKIISDHGGTIRIEDNSPQGARFVIELPT